MKVLVTGGAGFIGSALVRRLVAGDRSVVNVDKLTYAADLDNVGPAASSPAYAFEQADVADEAAMAAIFDKHKPDALVHLAAETHVDRSIDEPMAFLQSNVIGTAALLRATSAYLAALGQTRRERFRFIHVTTDEVYGSLSPAQPPVDEKARYAPSSPYAASKAASDHLVRAWRRTFGLPAMISVGPNTYGPRQFPEKLIPLMIRKALAGEALPLYGDGLQVRDWLHVDDHARALELLLDKGRAGETYNLRGAGEVTNVDLVHRLCHILDVHAPGKPKGVKRYEELIAFVPDRPGHDERYAMNADKIGKLGWTPSISLDQGLGETVDWARANGAWLKRTMARYDGGRLGAPR